MAQDDLTLVSTTDTAEQIHAALTGEPTPAVPAPASDEAPPAEGVSAAATAAATADAKADAKAEATPAAAANAEPPAEAEKPKEASKDPQKRINQAIARQRDAERERDAERARTADLQRQIDALRASRGQAPETAAEQAAAITETPAPQLEAFDSIDAFTVATAKWATDNAIARLKAEQQARQTETDTAARARLDAEQAARAQQTLVASHAARVDAFKAVTPDFEAVLTEVADLQTSPTITAHVLQSELGPAVIYHLAQHTDELMRIRDLPPAQQLVALGKLESRLEAAPSGPASSAAPVSKAPDPIQPVGSRATASTVPLDELDFQAYRKLRREQRAAAQRR